MRTVDMSPGFFQKLSSPLDKINGVATIGGDAGLVRGTPSSSPAIKAEEEWESFIPFSSYDLPSWPAGVFPPTVEEYVHAVAAAVQVPPDMAAMMALGVLATAIQRRIRVEPDPGWQEPTNLYLGLIAAPGTRKSAVVAEVTAPVVEWERTAAEAALPRIAQATTAAEVLLERAKLAKVAAAKVDPADRSDALLVAQGLATELARMIIPHSPRLIADDITPEKASSMICDQGGRLAIMAAESTFFSLVMGRYAKDGKPNQDLFLKAHAGDTLRVDRGTRSEYVADPALTIAICTQPEAIQGFLTSETMGRGSVGRILYSWPASNVGYRPVGAPQMPSYLRGRWRAMAMRLLDIPYGDDPHVLYPSGDAVPAWHAFRTEVEESLRPGGAMDAMTDWGSKLPGAVARVAGVLHMAEHAFEDEPWVKPIGRRAMESAIAIGRYLIPHAMAVYGLMGADENRRMAQHLLTVIRDIGSPTITKRGLFERVKGRCTEATSLDDPLAILVSRGYLRKLPKPPGPGNHAARYGVHPSLHTPEKYSQYSQYPPAPPLTANTANTFVEDEIRAEPVNEEDDF